jgi:hypothetical protein
VIRGQLAAHDLSISRISDTVVDVVVVVHVAVAVAEELAKTSVAP